MAEARILVVDDEYLIRWSLKQSLEKEGYEVFISETGEDAINKVKSETPDVVLLDIKLPGIDGYEVLEKILKIDKDTIVIMITAYEEIDKVVKAIKLGAFDYIVKPFDFNKVLLSIQKALDTSKIKREIKYLRKEKKSRFGFDKIIAESPEMKKILSIVEKISESESSTILIHGESGTGKELIAHSIHYKSNRGNMPFVVVNCASFQEHFLENELCGRS